MSWSRHRVRGASCRRHGLRLSRGLGEGVGVSRGIGGLVLAHLLHRQLDRRVGNVGCGRFASGPVLGQLLRIAAGIAPAFLGPTLSEPARHVAGSGVCVGRDRGTRCLLGLLGHRHRRCFFLSRRGTRCRRHRDFGKGPWRVFFRRPVPQHRADEACDHHTRKARAHRWLRCPDPGAHPERWPLCKRRARLGLGLRLAQDHVAQGGGRRDICIGRMAQRLAQPGIAFRICGRRSRCARRHRWKTHRASPCGPVPDSGTRYAPMQVRSLLMA